MSVGAQGGWTYPAATGLHRVQEHLDDAAGQVAAAGGADWSGGAAASFADSLSEVATRVSRLAASADGARAEVLRHALAADAAVPAAGLAGGTRPVAV